MCFSVMSIAAEIFLTPKLSAKLQTGNLGKLQTKSSEELDNIWT